MLILTTILFSYAYNHSMKRPTLIFLFICSAWLTPEVNAQHMMNYINEEDGYILKFPEDWRRIDSFDTRLSLVALAPEETEAEDGVRENLNVALFETEKAGREVFYNEYKASHEKDHTSWKFIREGEIKSFDMNALFFVCQYANTNTGRTHGEVVYMFYTDDKAAVLTCTSSFSELETFMSTFDQSARSFSFDLGFE